MGEVVRGATLAFVIKVAGAGLAFGFNVAIARLLGADGAGVYFSGLSVVMIGSVIGRFGLDGTLLRFVSSLYAKDDLAGTRAVNALGLRIAVGLASGVALTGFLVSPWLAEALFRKPDLAVPLRWMCLAILPFAVFNLEAESLKGLKKVRDAMIVQTVCLPFAGLLLIWPLANGFGTLGAAWSYLGASAAAATLGMIAWRRATERWPVEPAAFPVKRLLQSCRPLFVTSLMSRAVLPWSPLFLLGIWASTEEVGIFGAATRVAMLASFMLATINNVLAPKLAELYARGEMDAMATTARRSAALVTLLASPVFLVLIFGAGKVLALFGPGFERGSLILAILAFGQLVNSLTGSVNYLLIVTGNEAIVRNVTTLAAAVLVVLCLILLPIYGALGAAVSAAVAVAGQNLFAAYEVWKKFGIVTIPLLPKAL